MLRTGLETDCVREWSEGLRFVQIMGGKTICQAGIKCSPYETNFVPPMKIGLKILCCPDKAFFNLPKEEELVAVIRNIEGRK
jgi:hypothetical protein